MTDHTQFTTEAIESVQTFSCLLVLLDEIFCHIRFRGRHSILHSPACVTKRLTPCRQFADAEFIVGTTQQSSHSCACVFPFSSVVAHIHNSHSHSIISCINKQLYTFIIIVVGHLFVQQLHSHLQNTQNILTKKKKVLLGHSMRNIQVP